MKWTSRKQVNGSGTKRQQERVKTCKEEAGGKKRAHGRNTDGQTKRQANAGIKW